MKQTPIIINNFNRLSSTRDMYEFLKKRNFNNIIILDNASTYPPLLAWYSTLKENEVMRFPSNIGAYCLFDSGYLENNIASEYVVYSDSDLELNEFMPDDFLETMKSLLLKYNEKKIGLALRIDDVPENCYKNCTTGSIDHERQFWSDELEKDVYRAMVDTTFCLLRNPESVDLRALRIAGNFTARHLPWYQDYSTLNEEEKYYLDNASSQSNFRKGYDVWLNERKAEPAGSCITGEIEKMEKKYFIAVYTNEVKNYCDEKFFTNLYALSGEQPVFVVDNTIGNIYYNKLQTGCLENEFNNFSVYHIELPADPKESQFQRSVCDSANLLRDIYLNQTDLEYFLVIESDVCPPVDLLDRFENSIGRLNVQDPGWGILGGLYYQGFHNYNFDCALGTLERTGHCLSGCTVYKREVIEKFPFRYDPANLIPFPDALICSDSHKLYSFWNEHQIKCEHLHNPANGLRIKSNTPAKTMEIPYVMPHQLEPFNGDTFIEQEFLKLKQRFNIETVIETGTCFGATTKFLGQHFKSVISLEINNEYLEIARSLLRPFNNIHTYCGASERLLNKLLSYLEPVGNNSIFFLDAHWGNYWPLRDELKVIAEHKIRPVIAIHDFQVPGQPNLAFDSYGAQPLTFDWLKTLFDDIYGIGGYDHYYNTEENSSEIRVGIIYITPTNMI